MRLNKASIGEPHDFLELPELAKEPGLCIVDFLSILTELWMLVLLNVPNGVGQCGTISACHFLLLETPIRQLDLVGKENAASHEMDELKLSLDRSYEFFGSRTIRQ